MRNFGKGAWTFIDKIVSKFWRSIIECHDAVNVLYS